MHPDETALLRAVVEAPEDDAPRLVLADWLEENGRPERAEFIRLQCARERAPAEPLRFAWSERLEVLWAAHRGAWLAELPRLRNVTWSPHFRRGFARGVDFSGVGAFIESADAVFAAAPIQVVSLGRAEGAALEHVVLSPYAGRLVELNLLYAQTLAHGAFVLATAPRLRGLRLLNLAGNLVGNEGARHLAGSASLANLEALVLTENRIGTAGGRALAESVTLSRSLKLYVRNNDIDPDTLSRLRDRFPRLVT